MNRIIYFRRCIRLAPQIYEFSNSQNIFKKIVENFKKEVESDKDIKENLEKFKKSAEDVSEIKKIRELYKKMEKEIPKDTTEKINSYYKSIVEKINKETDAVKKKELLVNLQKNLEKLKSILPSDLKDSQVVRQLYRLSDIIDDELVSEKNRVYRSPLILQTRDECAGIVHMNLKQKKIEANEEATGMELHKDSSWHEKWTDFKDNNQYMKKLFDLKTKYDESDAVAVRSFRWFTDKIVTKISNITNSEMSNTIAEIEKVDSSFDIFEFINYTQFKIIPNVYEGMLSGNIEIVRDWCDERAYRLYLETIKEAQQHNYKFYSVLHDIEHVDILHGQVIEDSPVFVVTFDTLITEEWRNKEGVTVKGDPKTVLKVYHHWVLRRDPTNLDPWAAWKLAEFSMHSKKVLF